MVDVPHVADERALADRLPFDFHARLLQEAPVIRELPVPVLEIDAVVDIVLELPEVGRIEVDHGTLGAEVVLGPVLELPSDGKRLRAPRALVPAEIVDLALLRFERERQLAGGLERAGLRFLFGRFLLLGISRTHERLVDPPRPG